MAQDGRRVEVRDAEASDEAPLVRLLLAAEDWAVASTGYLPGPGDLQSLMYALPTGADPAQKRLLTVVLDGEVVGLIDAVVDWPQAGTVAVGVFLVGPAAQRRGVGTAALRTALRSAREAGYRAVRAACPRGWAPGEAFLAGHGFERGERISVGVNRVEHPHEAEHPSDPWLLDL